MGSPSTPVRNNTRRAKNYDHYNSALSSPYNEHELSKYNDTRKSNDSNINYIQNSKKESQNDNFAGWYKIRIDNLLEDENTDIDDTIQFDSELFKTTSHEKGKIQTPLILHYDKDDKRFKLKTPKTRLSYHTKFPYFDASTTKWNSMIGGSTILHHSMMPDNDSYGYSSGFVRLGYKLKENVDLYGHMELGLAPKVRFIFTILYCILHIP